MSKEDEKVREEVIDKIDDLLAKCGVGAYCSVELRQCELELAGQICALLNTREKAVAEELRIGNILTAKLTDKCRELELTLSTQAEEIKGELEKLNIISYSDLFIEIDKATWRNAWKRWIG